MTGRQDMNILFYQEKTILPDDTVPRFPVKKTQIESYKDLKVNPPIDLKTPSNVKTTIEYDPSTGYYVYRTKIGDTEIATPFSLSADEYRQQSLKQSMSDYFKSKNNEAYENKDEKEEFSLKDINLNLGAAERLFGPGGVKVRTQGYVEARIGIKHNSTDNPTLSDQNRSRTTFEFKEDIQMNVSASVGDKIDFGLNYDTKALLDFDSKNIKLGYVGKEDEIIKKIEAGNVSMSTTNSLINGGSSLFGINAELQFGKLRINTVISQQQTETRTVNTKGGVQTNEFEFKADQYDENRHFFLGHYFRDNYDKAMSRIPYVQSSINITRMEVWITNKRGDFTQSRNILAFADIAEHKVIKNPAKWSPKGSAEIPYNNANTLYEVMNQTYPQARDITQITQLFNGYIESGLDYEKVESARQLSSTEYTYNAQLGYLSLTSALQADEVLAVAYEYTMNGQTYQVGEFASDIVDKYDVANAKSGALFVRLLKPVSLSPRSYTWDLMMKNVYYLGATGIQQDKFRLNISYQSDTLGTYIDYLTEGAIKNQRLISVMNLDRLNSQNKEVSKPDGSKGDGIFDYIDGYTINSANGRVYFPVVEPFGSHLRGKINNSAIADKYVYQQLYDSTLTVARQIAEKNKFKIYGSYRGNSTSSSDIDLNTANIPQGAVRVTANGVTLTEGVDYLVNYDSGSVTILNQDLLNSNADIQTTIEQRPYEAMQRKTLLGLNLSYDISKDFNIGGTIMHLYEKPLTTKTLIGEESVKNTLWGLNMSYRTESMWLTNLIDKIPFIEATQPSHLNFNAEFAHMIPGHYKNEDAGGYSYLDDFETSESRIDIKSPYAWTLAATPYDNSATALFPEASKTNDIEYGKNRAMMSWFMIDPLFTRRSSSLTPSHIGRDEQSDHFVREIGIDEIYPNKDIQHTESATIPVLNISYYPEQRGPYNLDGTNISSEGKLLNPEKRWGGITRKMDVRDFESSNIEYIEFWMMDPFIYNDGRNGYPVNEGGDLYFNLGEISEDVLKDGKKFYENGLPVNDDPNNEAVDFTVWGKVPKRQSTVYAFDDNIGAIARQKQDVGLNGLSTAEEFEYPAYANYLDELRAKLSPTALEEFQNDPFSPFRDPAGDTYHFYRGSDYDLQQKSILDRYKYYNNTEGNSPSSDQTSESYSTASKSTPDVEDIDQDYTLNETEAYFQYKVSLDPTKMNVGENYIVDKREITVTLRNGNKESVTWYQFKVPVRQYDKKVGNIQDFKSIRFIRMFLTNFKQNTFLRFGTLQLVRGDWRVYEQALNPDNIIGNGALDVSTVNIEENSERKPVNYVLPPGIRRSNSPDQAQLIQENEQSLSMKVIDLDAGDVRAIYKNTNFDLRRYKRIQLFTHAENLIDQTDLKNGEFTIFMRLGSDYKNNYYEYEIPLEITPEGVYNTNTASSVWPTNNMFDFPLELLKDIKLKRNKEKRQAGSTVSYTTLYSDYDPEKPNNKVSVMGNPSLSDVYVIMIGVRNNSRLTKSGEVWINELRLTDFDEEGGWAAKANLNMALSDFGNITLSGHKETVGFGALDQRLMERRSDDYQSYTVAANFELGKFFPEKAQVSIPFYYSYSNQTSTPKYDPFDKDVTLKESLSLVDTKAEKDSIKSLAQEKSTTKSISFNNVRVNVQSKNPMPYDPANFSFGYTFSQTEIKNPSTVYDLTKAYRAILNYNYTPLSKTWEPFKNLKSNSGAAKYAKTLGFNYLPNNISFNSDINRLYTETALRDIESYSIGGSNDNEFLSWSQSFLWDRDFNLNWDFTKNLRFSFQSGTRAEIEEPYLQVNKKLNPGDYEIWKDSVMRSLKSLGTPLAYSQTARLTYQLPFKDIPAMNWVNSNASYTSAYKWDRGAIIDSVEIGNTISNMMTLELKTDLKMTDLYNKWGFLKKVNERFDSQRRPQSPRQRERQTQQQARRRFNQTVMLADSAITVTHNLNTKNIEVLARKDGQPYSLKFKKTDNNSIRINNKDSANIQLVIESKADDSESPKLLTEIAEYTARGLMSLRGITFNYSRRNETHISGFRPGIGDAFGQKSNDSGMTPGLGFALGIEGGEDYIEKALERNWLVMNQENITPAVYTQAEKFDLKAQIEPFKDFKIELTSRYEKSERTELQYMYESMPRSLGGNFLMSTISLKTTLKGSNSKNNYQSDAFDDFIRYRNIIKQRLESKYQNTSYPNAGFINEYNPMLPSQGYNPAVGSVDPNSSDVLIPAFIAAYTGRDPDKISLTAFPSIWALLPNWTLRYDGLAKVSFLKDKFKSLSLTHSYRSEYSVGSYNSFTNWAEAEDGLGYVRDVVSGAPIPSSAYNISSASILEVFNPLIGIESTLMNGMSINSQYNYARTLTLNMSSFQIIEYLEREFMLDFGWRINEFNKIIGIGPNSQNKFNNDLNIKVGVSHKTSETLLRKIEENFTQATTGLTIFTLRLSADYTMSRALTVKAFYDRILNKPLISSTAYPTTNSNFGISLKFTLVQ